MLIPKIFDLVIHVALIRKTFISWLYLWNILTLSVFNGGDSLKKNMNQQQQQQIENIFIKPRDSRSLNWLSTRNFLNGQL